MFRVKCLYSDGWRAHCTLVSQMGIVDKMGHVSTGGGACMSFLSGESLPVFAALANNALRFDVEIIMHGIEDS